jgi:hypothetical protein
MSRAKLSFWVIGALALLVPLAQLAQSEVLLDEGFCTDVIGSGGWTASDASVFVNVDSCWLRIGSDGAVNDYADKLGPFTLPFVIEWRVRTFSGEGSYTSLPKLEFYWGPSPNDGYHITYSQKPGDGWLFGFWTDIHILGPTSWNEWRTVKAVIRSDGGELFVKRDGDTAFTPIATATWAIPSVIERLSLSQHTDDVSDFDYIRVTTFWSCFESQLDDYVYGLEVYKGQLIAAGSFVHAGDLTVNYIAAYDGTTWSPLGTGMDNGAFALTVYDGKLIAAGLFTTAGDISAMKIASWDGISWSPIGSRTIDGSLNALAVFEGKLYAGGYYTDSESGDLNYIACWDGLTWSPLASGINGPCTSLAIWDNKLIVGGHFTTAGGTLVNYVAAWDGSSWSPLSSGVNQPVQALGIYNNNLITGGYFTAASGISASRIASWDGSDWSPIGSGMNSIVLVSCPR